jgi:cytochrome c oxidase cbb3-type subunit 1/cytochrome c oxidase cbb3-type subunit I/II
VLPEIHVYYVTRAGLGVMIFSSAVLGFYNVVRSLMPQAGEKIPEAGETMPEAGETA